MNLIIYDTITGHINRISSCPASMASTQAQTGETAIEGTADDATQIIDVLTETVIDKSILPSSINKVSILADGIDQIIISNLPNPTFISIEGEGRWIVSDGLFEFTVDTPGEYEFTCQSPLYLEVGYTINAS
jgi:hypothetical protein